jgi:hypothetical protein
MACSPSASAESDASRNFAISGFDAVRLAGSDNVRVVRGPVFSVQARGPIEILDRLDIRKDGNTLIVSRKPNGMFSWSRGSATVTVTMPRIAVADLAGSGNLAVDRADGTQFDATLTGSGDLSLASIDAGSLKLRVTGSGDVTAAGRARAAAFTITGSGSIKADGLTAGTASLSVIGSGDVSARATQSATLSVAGSGNAAVQGTSNCSISKSGSGEARCTG